VPEPPLRRNGEHLDVGYFASAWRSTSSVPSVLQSSIASSS
jgi:hypothetical protein